MPSILQLVAASAILFPLVSQAADPAPLPPPPQDLGLPYTRSARTVALKKIGGHLGVFAGSRYAYVDGYRTRLDPANVLGGEAVLRDGRVLVPAAFAAVLDLGKPPSPAPAPTYLADRWVYDIGLPPAMPVANGTMNLDGKSYVDLAALARAAGKKVYQHPRGLLLIGAEPITFSEDETVLLDAVISQFDTPDKFADPDIATRHIPNLARQGKWTDHVKVSPEQLALVNGPETKWETVTLGEYDFTGFKRTLLGSKVPPPGVYPRILFSPEDVPAIARRIKDSHYGQMSLIEMKYLLESHWWNPGSSDGKLFRALLDNDFQAYQPDGKGGFVGHTPGIYHSHVNYITECLQTMALYCLITEDDTRGRQVAQAIANYYRSREPDIDEVYARSDSEFGSSRVAEDGTLVSLVGTGAVTHGRGVTEMNRGLSLDFAGKWMTPEEKDLMRRIIAKTTYGRRAYGQDAPARFRDINWMTWDLTQFLALSAIEGLEGFDPEAYASNLQSIKGFCDWGISPHGVIFESNGKTGPGNQFFFLATVAAARRGENHFGHPHLRKLLQGQVMASSPTGRVTVSSGTQYAPYSRSPFADHIISEMKGFFPDERHADYLLSGNTGTYARPDLAEFRAETESGSRRRVRLPSPTHPFGARTVLFDGDVQPTTRAELGLPLDLIDPVEGMLSSYSDHGPDGVWLNLHVRPNHYFGAGHHHADAGMFHFSALGVDWFTESPFSQTYTGNLHNLVMVDGLSQADGYQGAAKFLGGVSRPLVSSASADLAYAYSWRWHTQPGPIWPEDAAAKGWEMDPSPEIARIFAGTARYKMRPWWWNYNYSNYIATSRSPYNPVQRALRSAGLVRGEHAYAFVLDDIKKDDETRLYQWSAMLNGGVRRADIPGLPPGQLALAYREGDPVMTDSALQAPVVPSPGEPLVIVCALGHPAASATPDRPPLLVERIAGQPNKKGETQHADRLTVELRAADAEFRILLIPARAGEPLPAVSYDAARKTAEVRWPGQTDQLTFAPGTSGAPAMTVQRGGKLLTP